MATTGETTSGRELNKATTRVLRALTSFATDVDGYGVTELSQRLGMTKNMTYRALTTLVKQGYLIRGQDGARYHLGYRILELQSPHAIEPNFRTLCGPYLKRIHALTGESVSLAVRALDYCVLVDGIETRKPGVWRVRIGDVLPLFGPASGRVLLAFTDDAQVADYFNRHKPMVHPRTGETFNAEDLRREIGLIREQGYARVVRPAPSPMVSISFPVRDLDGALHGAISVGGPPERSQTELDAHMDDLKAIVAELDGRARLFSADVTGSELH